MSETIKVALRVRPLVENEISRGCQTCLDVALKENQVVIQNHKGFTYNYVFDQNSSQDEVYTIAVQSLVEKLFEGFNVTILAYGQTGSGKTHTMGTSYAGDDQMGVIPKAVQDIFGHVSEHPDWEFKITVSFMELYNEQLFDLLAADKAVVEIREDTKGICIPGLTETSVSSIKATMQCLQVGSTGRVTGSTAMNSQSSRSHAIFTITIHQQKRDDSDTATTAKFHLVDLAGSERSKKTQAVGDRFKEGVNINFGLLALGNVISALGEGSKQVPSYRTSKLTRLLQDSLGGNSMTLMIACVSPADYNLVETMSTLRYADRARRIKNKPIVNQDSKSAEIAELKRKISQLQLELVEQGGGGACPESHEHLEAEVKKLSSKIRLTTQRYNDVLNENTNLSERILMAESARDRMKQRMAEMEAEMKKQLEVIDQLATSGQLSEHLNVQLTALKTSFTQNMSVLQKEHKQTESEMWAHECNANNNPLSDSVEDLAALEGDADQELDLQQEEEHAAKQTQLNKALRELTRQLALKEEVCEKYSRNTVLTQLTLKENQKLQEQYEGKINELLKEKADLITSIKTLQSANKEADLRAKQVELTRKNTEIETLQKKLANQAKSMKQKEAAEKKVEILNNEIVTMKQAKVKLIKQMKSESDKFRTWRIAREREATRLKDQDRKMQSEMARMKNLHTKQYNVYKRKLEEASAANKRLKEAMQKQRMAQETRKAMRGHKEQVQEFVAHELEVLVSTVDAERTLQQLLEDRCAQSTQLAELRSLQKSDPSPSLAEELVQVQQELDLRSAQIADLQQKILDSDQENKANTRWDAVQSMADAKIALKHVFALFTDMRKDAMMKEYTLKELQAVHEVAGERIRELEKEKRRAYEKHRNELLAAEKEQQEMLTCLLNAEDKENNPHQEEMLRKQVLLLENTQVELDRTKQEKEQLESQMSTILAVAKTPKQRKGSRRRMSKVREFEDLNISTDGSFIDDLDKDPDWANTPIHKKLMAMKMMKKEREEDNTETRKRGSDGSVRIRCGCHSQCNTRRCVCYKGGGKCCDECQCDLSKCQIRSDSTSSSSAIDLDKTFIKPEDPDRKRPRYTYTLPSVS